MQNFKSIRNIANIVSGYTFRGAIKEQRDSDLFVLQSKNINDSLYIDENKLTETQVDLSHTKAFAKDGDVAIGTRGSFKSAVLKTTKRVIASSSVYLLRINPASKCLPEYLSIYLNSPSGQKDISLLFTGAAIKFILRKDLESLPIPIPPIDQQEKIVALFNNISEQEKILKRKSELNKAVLNSMIYEIVRRK